MSRLFIIVQTQFEGMHCYPDAPAKVAYLRNMHRHMFHVKAEIEVFNNDRELEFVIVKNDLDAFLKTVYVPDFVSCEMYAELIQTYLKSRWDIENEELKAKLNRKRIVDVTVMEDNENGVKLEDS